MKRFLTAVVLLLLGVGLLAGPAAVAQEGEGEEAPAEEESSGEEESGSETAEDQSEPQTAGSATAPLMLRAVDTSDPDLSSLEFMYGGDPGDVSLTENGELASVDPPQPLSDSDVCIHTIYVIDTGAKAEELGTFSLVKAELQNIVAELEDCEEIGLIVAGDQATLIQDLTESERALSNGIDNIGASTSGGASVWAGVRRATRIMDGSPNVQNNIVVLTTGQDITDANLREVAIDTATSAGASIWVAVQDGGNTGPFEGAVESMGGRVIAADTAGEVASAASTFDSWLHDDQYIVRFSSTAAGAEGLVEAVVTIDGQAVDFAFVSGRQARGTAQLAPFDPGLDRAFDIPGLSGSTGRLVGVGLLVVGIVGFIWSLGTIFSPDEGALSNVLEPYSEAPSEFDDADDGESALTKTALIQRAVSITEQVAESQGYLGRTESALERADLPLRAAEALFFYLAAASVVAIGAMIMTSFGQAMVLSVLAILLPPIFVSVKAARRRAKFQELLPDTLQLLSGTLRAGYSLMQGVEAVSQEVSEPMGKELRRVVTESRLGRPLEESLDGVAERMASADFAWAVMAIRIQREVGGNLSELLLTVGDTMVARERLRRDINALTAEGRVSAVVLGALPVGLGVVMWGINPKYINRLFETTMGNILLGLAIFSMGAGFAWMRKIIQIEI